MSEILFKDYGNVVKNAFHGTSLEYAQSIVNNGFRLIESTDELYLGTGIYFYEASQWHAQRWAADKYGKKRVAVIQAEIKLGHCLDFSNRESIALVKRVAEELKQRGIEPTDHKVINFIATQNTIIDTIRGVLFYPEKGIIFEGSRFGEFQQTMICVRNPDCIANCEIVYDASIAKGSN